MLPKRESSDRIPQVQTTSVAHHWNSTAFFSFTKILPIWSAGMRQEVFTTLILAYRETKSVYQSVKWLTFECRELTRATEEQKCDSRIESAQRFCHVFGGSHLLHRIDGKSFRILPIDKLRPTVLRGTHVSCRCERDFAESISTTPSFPHRLYLHHSCRNLI